MKIIKRVCAPVRIDFAGGTTDIYPFTHTHGGAVLNAAINRYVTGELIKTDEDTHLEYTGNAPTSSGLGTSGVMNLVWLALISKTKDKAELAEKVYSLEQAMGLVGGKQDQYAAAFGGINFLEFEGDKVKATKLILPKDLVKKLEENLTLVYTGKPHFSGDSNALMINNLRKGKNTRSLLKIKEIATEMKNSLANGDLEMFSILMDEETKEREKLHKSIISHEIRRLIRQGKESGASAAKVCGSGGGGSILFFGDKRKLKNRFGKRVIDFRFDFEGLRWL